MLARRIGEAHGSAPLTMGGPREAAELINGAGKVVEKRVMPEIGKLDKALAKEIESEMFKFEHLFVLDPQAMGALLREVDNDSLIDALKGIAEEQRSPFFKAMSSRAAEGIQDEIANRGRLKMADVLAAQKTIVGVARRLAAAGTLALPLPTLSAVFGTTPRAPPPLRKAADPFAEPFAGLPLRLTAVLVEMRLPLTMVAGLEPGMVLPVAVARQVPLRAAGLTVATGTVGAADDRVALQITNAF
jgi:flagellar motor switch/type III secretory pathway protein FliN